MYHVEDEGSNFSLSKLSVGPHGGVVGIPSLVVFSPEVAVFAVPHFVVVIVEESDHGRPSHSTRNGCGANGTHDIMCIERAQRCSLAGKYLIAGKFHHLLQGFWPGGPSALNSQNFARGADE